MRYPITDDLTDKAFAIYGWGFVITGSIVFVGSYIYCITTYGFLFGVGLGWLPSLIVAFLAALLWPLIFLLPELFIFLLLIGYFFFDDATYLFGPLAYGVRLLLDPIFLWLDPFLNEHFYN